MTYKRVAAVSRGREFTTERDKGSVAPSPPPSLDLLRKGFEA